VDGVYHGDSAGVKNNTNVPTLVIEQESGTFCLTSTMAGIGVRRTPSLTVVRQRDSRRFGLRYWRWWTVYERWTVAAVNNGTATFNINGAGVQTAWFDFTGCMTMEMCV